MYLRQCVGGDIGNQIVDIQYVHHHPNGDGHNQSIQRADDRKAENACGLFHPLLLYAAFLLFYLDNQVQFV